jgi:hypothetical protein
VRPRHDDPEVPEDVQARDLDKVARNELKSLSKDNADWVAKHLVMASRLIDEDPELAHLHALSAARRAGRIAVVRETLAITAYETGDYALALRELRTFRRISGSDEQLPLMVDSERGVGRPEKALELGRSVDRATLTPAAQVSLAIAMSGARLDLGSPELALGELEIPQLDPDRAFSYSPALYDAYAEVLSELGRVEDAAVWRKRAAVAIQLLGDPDESETIEIVEEEIEGYDDAGEDLDADGDTTDAGYGGGTAQESIEGVAVDVVDAFEVDAFDVDALDVDGDDDAPGALGDESVEAGTTEDGPAEDGPAEDGPVEDGPVEDGTVEDGTVEDGTEEDGTEEEDEDGAVRPQED